MINSSENVSVKPHEILPSGLDVKLFQKADREMSRYKHFVHVDLDFHGQC